MKKRKLNLTEGQVLRQKAEEILKSRQSKNNISVSETDPLKLIHELEVHQIELEIQNKELKQNEEKLSNLNKRQEAICSSIPGIIMEVDSNKVYTWANQAGIDFFGEDVIGKEASVYFEGEQKTYDLAKPLFDGQEETLYIESWQRRKDGAKRLLGWWCRVLKDENGNVRGIFSSARDITEQKKAEEALTESEKKFRAVIEEAVDTVFIINMYGYFTYVNPAGIKATGYTLEELSKFNYVDLIEPEYKQKIKRYYLRQYLERSSASAIEYPYRSKSGKIKWFNQNARLLIEKGKVTGYYAIARDVTKRREMEDALRESERKYSSLFSSMNEGVALHEVVYDKNNKAIDYVITETNPSYETNTGIKFQANGKQLASKFYGLPTAPYLDVYSRVAETGIPTSFESYFSPINKYFEISVFSPKKGMFATIFTDITERKKAELQLQKQKQEIENQSEEYMQLNEVLQQTNFDLEKAKDQAEESRNRIQTLINTIPDLIWLKDAEGVYLQCNKRFEDFFGAKESEIVGKTDYDFVDKKMGDFFRAHDKAAMLAGGPTINEEQITFAIDGHKEYLETIKMPLYDTNKKIIGVLGIGRDITQRIEAEQELVKAKEHAEKSDRLKSAFLANMSHEIRTPMNGILGFTDLLKEPKLSGEEQQKYIEIIEKSGTRMLNIINDIINISKIESGLMEVSISQTNIDEQLDYIYNFFKAEAKQLGIEITLKKPIPSIEVNIKTDREKVYAVLTNLVKNAIKFTPEGLIEIGYIKKGNYLEFFVKDSGKGIDLHQKEIIFERFRQGNETSTRNYEGAGLGLSISKAYIEMLGGKIWVESDPDGKSGRKGSEFYFTIPIEKPTEASDISTKKDSNIPELEQSKTLKILIAEDDPTSEIFLKIILEKYGKEFISAKAGDETVEICQKTPDIDLIMMDIQMPVIDGYEATRQIREFNKEVVIIAQTAYGFSDDKDKVLDAGCNDYISKPIKKSELLKLIEKYFVVDKS